MTAQPQQYRIETVAVIGAGRLGRRLAALFSAAGYETILEDILPSKLRVAAETIGSGYSGEVGVAGNLRFASSVEDAVRTADLIVDGVPDELESKLEIFSLLDRMAPPLAVFVTPTQSLSIADLASCTYRADRCVAIEFASSEVLEGESVCLVSTSNTSIEVLEAVTRCWRRLGFAVESRLDSHEASVANGTLF